MASAYQTCGGGAGGQARAADEDTEPGPDGHGHPMGHLNRPARWPVPTGMAFAVRSRAGSWLSSLW